MPDIVSNRSQFSLGLVGQKKKNQCPFNDLGYVLTLCFLTWQKQFFEHPYEGFVLCMATKLCLCLFKDSVALTCFFFFCSFFSFLHILTQVIGT